MTNKIEVRFTRSTRVDKGAWFDNLLPRVRSLRAFLSDEQIAEQIVPEGEYTVEELWLALNAAKILDGAAW